MADFTLSQERIQDASNIIVQFLRDAGYEGSLEDGTGLNDIVVKPNALLREYFAQMVDRVAAYQSLQKAAELKDTIGEEEYDAAIDCILSNWFVTRNDGKPSTGVLRYWFLQPMEFMQFTDGESVGSIDNVSLVVDGNQVFTQDSFSYILNTTDNQNEYYVDVAVRTAENSAIEPSADGNNSVTCTYNDIYFLRATIPGTFTAGTVMESSEDFIRRTEQAITTRELITSRAINTVILNEFSDVLRLYVARHGSSEQLRDIILFQNILVHVGNKADIYIASWMNKEVLEVQAIDGKIDPAQLPLSNSVVAYLGATDTAGNPLDLSLACEETTWCSNNNLPTEIDVKVHNAKIVLADSVGMSETFTVLGAESDAGEAPAIAGDSDNLGYTSTVRLTMLTDTVLGLVHDFVYSEEQRVTCYDPMVKHMYPVVLRITLNVELIDKTVDSTAVIKAAVLEYVQYLVINAQPWVASELVATVHVRCSNVKKIFLPIAATATIFDPRRQRFDVLEVGNKFSIGDDYTGMHSMQISENTVQFYTDADLITVISDYAAE